MVFVECCARPWAGRVRSGKYIIAVETKPSNLRPYTRATHYRHVTTIVVETKPSNIRPYTRATISTCHWQIHHRCRTKPSALRSYTRASISTCHWQNYHRCRDQTFHLTAIHSCNVIDVPLAKRPLLSGPNIQTYSHPLVQRCRHATDNYPVDHCCRDQTF